jgi:hypothetical protein
MSVSRCNKHHICNSSSSTLLYRWVVLDCQTNAFGFVEIKVTVPFMSIGQRCNTFNPCFYTSRAMVLYDPWHQKQTSHKTRQWSKRHVHLRAMPAVNERRQWKRRYIFVLYAVAVLRLCCKCASTSVLAASAASKLNSPAMVVAAIILARRCA